MNRRNKRQRSAEMSRAFGFSFVMNCHGDGLAADIVRIVKQGGPQFLCQSGGPGDCEKQAPFTRRRSDFFAEAKPVARGKAVMTKHDSAEPRREPIDGFPQLFADPLVGHQPLPRP